MTASNRKLVTVVQGRSFSFDELAELLLLACGGTYNPAYFQLLETEISEVLYHLELFERLQRRLHPQNSPEGRLNAWGMSGVEFEEF